VLQQADVDTICRGIHDKVKIMIILLSGEKLPKYLIEGEGIAGGDEEQKAAFAKKLNENGGLPMAQIRDTKPCLFVDSAGKYVSVTLTPSVEVSGSFALTFDCHHETTPTHATSFIAPPELNPATKKCQQLRNVLERLSLCEHIKQRPGEDFLNEFKTKWTAVPTQEQPAPLEGEEEEADPFTAKITTHKKLHAIVSMPGPYSLDVACSFGARSATMKIHLDTGYDQYDRCVPQHLNELTAHAECRDILRRAAEVFKAVNPSGDGPLGGNGDNGDVDNETGNNAPDNNNDNNDSSENDDDGNDQGTGRKQGKKDKGGAAGLSVALAVGATLAAAFL